MRNSNVIVKYNLHIYVIIHRNLFTAQQRRQILCNSIQIESIIGRRAILHNTRFVIGFPTQRSNKAHIW